MKDTLWRCEKCGNESRQEKIDTYCIKATFFCQGCNQKTRHQKIER
jgi:hypothetical protein